METLLKVENLSLSFQNDSGSRLVVAQHIGFQVGKAESFGIVGESGSGKSVTVKSILRVNPGNCRVESGNIAFGGRNLLALSEKELLSIRGSEISMIFQDSLSTLNPVYSIGAKLIECLRRHKRMQKAEACRKSVELLRSVGIREPEQCMKSYPHQLSGGMRQRVLIAMAVSTYPKLLIADEPTTALDVTVQLQILRLLRRIQKDSGMSILLITHDLGVVAQMCSRIAVMCGGHIVEDGTAEDIFYRPAHPYTQALLASMPGAGKEPVSSFTESSGGGGRRAGLCPYLGRCPLETPECRRLLPERRSVSETQTVMCHVKR